MVKLGNYILTGGLGQDLYGWKILNGLSRLLYIYQRAGTDFVWKEILNGYIRIINIYQLHTCQH